MIQQDKQTVHTPHNIIMENRKKLTISGVRDIDSFNEQLIEAVTEMGALSIKGEGLHINKLNKDSKEISIEGRITSLIYCEPKHKSSGTLFKGLFK